MTDEIRASANGVAAAGGSVPAHGDVMCLGAGKTMQGRANVPRTFLDHV